MWPYLIKHNLYAPNNANEPEAWQDQYGAYLQAYGNAEQSAFEALVTANPFKAYQALLGHGAKAYHYLHDMSFPPKDSSSVARLHAERQAALWQNVPPSLHRAYSSSVIAASLCRIGYNAAPKPLKPLAQPVMDKSLSAMFSYKQEIAALRMKHPKSRADTPYEAIIHEYNAEYGEEKLAQDTAVIISASNAVKQSNRPCDHTDQAFTLDATFKQKRHFFKQTAKSMGLHEFRIYQASAPAALGSPDWGCVANNFNCKDDLSGIRSGMHELGHLQHKMGLPKALQRQPEGEPVSRAHDEAIAMTCEMILETPEYTGFVSEKAVTSLGGDPAIWQPDRMIASYACQKFSANRHDCCRNGNWLHLCALSGIERDIINGKERAEDYPRLWQERIGASLNLDIPDDNRDYSRNFQHFAGLEFASYISGIVSAPQIYMAAEKGVPEIKEQLAQGDLSGVAGWMTTNFHSKASTLPIDTLYRQATGEPRNDNPFREVIGRKYGVSL